MWVGMTDPQTASADAGTHNFDISLPTIPIRNLKISAANISGVRGVISVLIQEKNSYHPLKSALPVYVNETIIGTIPSAFVPEGKIRAQFLNCTAGDELHVFITYDVWRQE